MLLAFDGTWNEVKSAGEYGAETNVVRLAEWYRAEGLGPVHYLRGVGTRYGMFGKLVGGAFGVGMENRIQSALDAVRFNTSSPVGLKRNPPIDVCGFSRGAAGAYFACQRLVSCGYPVRSVILFDLVTALGWNAPLRLLPFIPQRLRLHWNLEEFAQATGARYTWHGLSVDEERRAFQHTRIKASEEQYFPAPEGWRGEPHGWVGQSDQSFEAAVKAISRPTAIGR